MHSASRVISGSICASAMTASMGWLDVGMGCTGCPCTPFGGTDATCALFDAMSFCGEGCGADAAGVATLGTLAAAVPFDREGCGAGTGGDLEWVKDATAVG